MDICISLVIRILNDYTAVRCCISIPKLDHTMVYLSVSYIMVIISDILLLPCSDFHVTRIRAPQTTSLS